MREGIHPNYVECKITCACGSVIATRSTRGRDTMIDVCSNCHPFYTGKQKAAYSGGRVEKFQKRYAKSKKA